MSHCFDKALDCLSPPRCVVCSRLEDSRLCGECESLFEKIPKEGCIKCGLGRPLTCDHCQWMVSLAYCDSVYDYRSAGGVLVKQLKYHRVFECVPFIREALKEILEYAPYYDYLVPIPIHWSRWSERGFNQSELIAKTLDDNKLRTDVLFRIRATPPQARKSGKARRENMNNAFFAKNVKDKNILLVDDVVTSGATLESAADCLINAGANWVGALTYAREINKTFDYTK